jgi:hypothetical protein
MFENKILGRISGPERGQAIRDRKELHNEELHNLCFSANIIRMIKSRRISKAE